VRERKRERERESFIGAFHIMAALAYLPPHPPSLLLAL